MLIVIGHSNRSHMEPTLGELRKNYEKFDKNKLIRIATDEASGLRPEAVDLLKQAIRERGLSENIIKGIDTQFREVDEEVLLKYAELLRNLPCPICKSPGKKLNATMTGSVISFVVMTNYDKDLKIGCPNCLDRANNKAMIKSALLGWWGFPWGIIRTSQALLLNNKMKKFNRMEEPNDLFKAFVLGKIGRLEASRNDKAELQKIIRNF